MNEIGQNFIAESREFLSAKYLPKIEKCLEQLSDEDLWRRPNAESNSVSNLILHIEGNICEWLIGGVGKLPFEREQQQEFDEREELPRKELIESLRRTVKVADEVPANLDAAVLTERREIQKREVTFCGQFTMLSNIFR